MSDLSKEQNPAAGPLADARGSENTRDVDGAARAERRGDRTRALASEGAELAAVRERLAAARGRDYWRSLEDLAATPEFQELVEREFPRQSVGWSDDENPAEG